MKLTFIAMLVAGALFLQACTSTYDLTTSPKETYPWAEKQYRTYQDFLAEAKGKTVQIVTSDGSHRLGRVTRADGDSIGWTNAKDSTRHMLASASVQSLTIAHSYGFYGLLLGFLAPTIPNILGENLLPGDKPHYRHLNTTI